MEPGLKSIIVAITPDTDIYASGDLIGEKLTISNPLGGSGGKGRLLSIVLADRAKNSAAIDLILFDANPSATTFTDNGPLTIVDADLSRICGVIPIVANDYAEFVDNTVFCLYNINLGIALRGSTKDLYACLVSRGTPTFAATTDLQLILTLTQN